MIDIILIWCCLSVLLSILMSVTCQWVAHSFIRDRNIITHVQEFFGNFVSSVFILESFVIGAKFGSDSLEWAVAVFIHLILKNAYFMTLKLYASPLSFIDIYYTNNCKRNFSFKKIVTIIITQGSAVLAGQYFGKFVWQFEDRYHLDRLRDVCVTTLSPHYSWQYAAMFEGSCIFLSTLIDFFTPYKLKPIVRPLVTVALVWQLGYVSGLWMNPILATMFTLRCRGHSSDLIHFMVYWVAPTIGVACAWELVVFINSFFYSSSQKSKVK